MDDCTGIYAPADTKELVKDEDGYPAMELWSYDSVVVMLLYLSGNSRPEISFEVHQCVRFTHFTRIFHEKSIKRIFRYLKETIDKGLIIKPTRSLNIDL